MQYIYNSSKHQPNNVKSVNLLSQMFCFSLAGIRTHATEISRHQIACTVAVPLDHTTTWASLIVIYIYRSDLAVFRLWLKPQNEYPRKPFFPKLKSIGTYMKIKEFTGSMTYLFVYYENQMKAGDRVHLFNLNL